MESEFIGFQCGYDDFPNIFGVNKYRQFPMTVSFCQPKLQKRQGSPGRKNEKFSFIILRQLPTLVTL